MKRLPLEPQAVIFDLDGTLLDTEPLYTEASQRVLAPFGHTYTLELKRRVMGGDATKSAQITIDEFNLPMTPEEYLTARQRHLDELFLQVPEINGASLWLEHLSNRDIPLGLATSSQQRPCHLKLGTKNWAHLFHTIVCGDDKALEKAKPAPDIFLLCLERMGAKPERSIAFEDSGNGVQAARAARMTVVAISSPYSSADDLAEADMIIDDYNCLLD